MFLAALLLAGGTIALGKELLQGLFGAPAADGVVASDRDEEVESKALDRPAAVALAPTEPGPSAASRELDRYLRLSIGSLGLGLAGIFFLPPLGLVSGAITLYSSFAIFQRAYRAVVEERRLRAAIIDSAAILIAIGSGFFAIAALANVLYFISRKLLLKTQDQSSQKLISLFVDQPRTVWVVKGDLEIETPFEALQAGDIVMVSAGQAVPVDGTIRVGVAAIDQRMLTGEAQPVDKGPGEPVLAATLVLSGRIAIEVGRAGGATVVAQIGDILNRTTDYRTEIESRGERLADKSVLPLLGLAAIALPTIGIQGAVAILNANFVDNMRVAVPLSMLNFLSRATQRGILVKDGRALELLHSVDTVVFDKTGTLTMEQPHVGPIHTCSGISSQQLLTYAAAAESKQGHPIARAIIAEAATRRLVLPPVNDARYEQGYGIDSAIAGQRILVGSARFMAMCGIAIPATIQAIESPAYEQGNSLVYIAIDGKLGGALELLPTVRPEIPAVIAALRTRGLKLLILSGDHAEPTRRLAAELGIDEYFAEVLPADKAALVTRLQNENRKVCFVGDGINDAIALKQANASISLSGATTVATDTAQIVMMDGTLRQLPELFALCEEFDDNMRASFQLNVVPALVCIAGVFFFHVGILASVALYNLSLAASVANAMRPRLKRAETVSA